MGDVVKLRKNLEALVSRADSWVNALTGHGTSRDKRTASRVGALWHLTDAELEALYYTNDMAARIVDALPDEAMREPYDLVFADDDGEVAGDVIEAAAHFDVRQNALCGWKWGRLYGACGVLVGADDGQPMDMPLAEDRIRAIHYMQLVTRQELQPIAYESNPLAPGYGEAIVFQLQQDQPAGGGVSPIRARVHRTRLVLFGGVPAPARVRARNQGWPVTVLQRPYDVLRDFGISWAGAANLLTDAAQGVLKMHGFYDMITSGDKDTVQTRMELTDLTRSVMRMMVVDADSGEEFTRIATPFTGIPEMMQLFIQRLAGAADMPATKIMGMSPAGMNATGESDTRGWYNRVESAQENELRSPLERMLRLIMLAKDGPTGGKVPDGFRVTFRPLWKPTAKERIEMRKITAESDAIYINAQVVYPEEVAIARMGPEGWEADMRVDLEMRRAMLESGLDDRIEGELGDDDDSIDKGPEPEPEPTPGPAKDPDPAGVDIQKTAFSGIQVTAMETIVKGVAARAYPRSSGIAMLVTAFQMEVAEAESVMAEVGRTFFSSEPANPANDPPVDDPPVPPKKPPPPPPPTGDKE